MSHFISTLIFGQILLCVVATTFAEKTVTCSAPREGIQKIKCNKGYLVKSKCTFQCMYPEYVNVVQSNSTFSVNCRGNGKWSKNFDEICKSKTEIAEECLGENRQKSCSYTTVQLLELLAEFPTGGKTHKVTLPMLKNMENNQLSSSIIIMEDKKNNNVTITTISETNLSLKAVKCSAYCQKLPASVNYYPRCGNLRHKTPKLTKLWRIQCLQCRHFRGGCSMVASPLSK